MEPSMEPYFSMNKMEYVKCLHERLEPVLDLILEGLPKPVKIAPYLIRNLSHDLNIGEQFLRKNKAEIKFEGTKVTLKQDNIQLEF